MIDSNKILSLYDSENKSDSNLEISQIMAKLDASKKAKSKTKSLFVIISLFVIAINIMGISMLLNNSSSNNLKSDSANEWQTIYSSLLIDQNPN
jgi:hypothetical protein